MIANTSPFQVKMMPRRGINLHSNRPVGRFDEQSRFFSPNCVYIRMVRIKGWRNQRIIKINMPATFIAVTDQCSDAGGAALKAGIKRSDQTLVGIENPSG